MEFNGLDQERKEVQTMESEAQEVKSTQKRKPFAVWTVGGGDYRLKLKASSVCEIEAKLKSNLLDLMNGVPPLSIMLTIIQGAMQGMNHKVKFKDVQDLYDTYVEEGGTQLTLFTDVIMEILKVSGFFTATQMNAMEEKMEDVKGLL